MFGLRLENKSLVIGQRLIPTSPSSETMYVIMHMTIHRSRVGEWVGGGAEAIVSSQAQLFEE
jgi:hypothetical protein